MSDQTTLTRRRDRVLEETSTGGVSCLRREAVEIATFGKARIVLESIAMLQF
jgi:hypothetical protein